MTTKKKTKKPATKLTELRSRLSSDGLPVIVAVFEDGHEEVVAVERYKDDGCQSLLPVVKEKHADKT